MVFSKKGSYLDTDKRLSDVIAAIQAMGTYKYYKRDFSGWAKSISGDRSQANYWENIIKSHPEFFRLNTEKNQASLVWRRNYHRNYHVDKNKQLTQEELEQLSGTELDDRVSRMPLSSSDISVLVSTAINIHNRQLERAKESRWWITPVFGLIGVAVGVLLKTYFEKGS